MLLIQKNFFFIFIKTKNKLHNKKYINPYQLLKILI